MRSGRPCTNPRSVTFAAPSSPPTARYQRSSPVVWNGALETRARLVKSSSGCTSCRGTAPDESSYSTAPHSSGVSPLRFHHAPHFFANASSPKVSRSSSPSRSARLERSSCQRFTTSWRPKKMSIFSSCFVSVRRCSSAWAPWPAFLCCGPISAAIPPGTPSNRAGVFSARGDLSSRRRVDIGGRGISSSARSPLLESGGLLLPRPRPETGARPVAG
mmetsp:Transcript_898/g.2909  ORF Transcript_898/g.2909 Transcript_898/m.2909 type:complete len:217 (+) Transcript_898:346-996(+)